MNAMLSCYLITQVQKQLKSRTKYLLDRMFDGQSYEKLAQPVTHSLEVQFSSDSKKHVHLLLNSALEEQAFHSAN